MHGRITHSQTHICVFTISVRDSYNLSVAVSMCRTLMHNCHPGRGFSCAETVFSPARVLQQSRGSKRETARIQGRFHPVRCWETCGHVVWSPLFLSLLLLSVPEQKCNHCLRPFCPLFRWTRGTGSRPESPDPHLFWVCVSVLFMCNQLYHL